MDVTSSLRRREWLYSLKPGDSVQLMSLYSRSLGIGVVVTVEVRMNHMVICYPDGARFLFSLSSGLSIDRNNNDWIKEPLESVLAHSSRERSAAGPLGRAA